MNTVTLKISDYPEISFNESDFVKVESDHYLNKDHKYGELELIECPTWWQERGLMYTATGYGSKIPTRQKVKLNNRLYRVYCHITSNSGSCYILIKNKRVYLR